MVSSINKNNLISEDSKKCSTENLIALTMMDQCVISRVSDISTGTFSHCHVLVGHDPKTKFNFLAHISVECDELTIYEIFNQLESFGVVLKDLTNVQLMGGLESEPVSVEMGDYIISILDQKGIKFGKTFFRKKISVDDQFDERGFFNGGILSKETGKFNFFQKFNIDFERKQTRKNFSDIKEKMALYYKKHGGPILPFDEERQIALDMLPRNHVAIRVYDFCHSSDPIIPSNEEFNITESLRNLADFSKKHPFVKSKTPDKSRQNICNKFKEKKCAIL